MSDEIFVTKRNGKTEPLNYDKIHNILFWSTEGLKNVTVSDIEMNARLKLYDGISSSEIHQVLIQSCADLISEEFPNYQYVASKLLSYYLRKEVFGSAKNLPHIQDVMTKNIEGGIYDDIIKNCYNEEELDTINDYLKHERDFDFSFAGIRQLIDKYLLKNRKTGEIFETPQYMYMMIAMTFFKDYKGGRRLQYVRKFYNAISQFKINLPTPVMCGVRTPVRQYSSCVLVDVDDTMDSIIHSDAAITKYTSQRAGIGLNVGRIRAVNSQIRSGEVVHTGVIPFLKKFAASVKSCTQNGVRGGSATVHYPFWHLEFEDLIVLKNNKGTEDNRVRTMDYSIQLNKTFYKRVQEGKDITFFSPHEVPELYEAFYGDPDEFEKLYKKCERNTALVKKKMKAIDAFKIICQERFETGRIYIMNVDHCNTHSSFLDKVYMSNLCVSGDTILHATMNGAAVDIKIEELNDLFHIGTGHKEFKVLSKNLETGELEYKPITNSALTNHKAQVLKITDEDTGKTITCTPDHQVYTKNRGYVLAKELKEDDQLDLC